MSISRAYRKAQARSEIVVLLGVAWCCVLDIKRQRLIDMPRAGNVEVELQRRKVG
jgi:hypothetical protein